MAHSQLDNVFQEIAKLGQSGQFAQVTSLCQQVLQQYPDTPQAYHFLGLAALQQGKSHQALTYLEKAIEISPNTVEFYNHAGVAYCNLGRWQQGIATYQKALTLNPNSPDTRYNLALALQKSGQLDPAILTYQHLLKEYPRYAPGHAGLGNIFLEKKQFQSAINCYQNALQIQNSSPESWYNLGVCWQSLNELDRAREAYENALKINPNYAEAHNSLGTILELNRSYHRAITEYEIAQKLNPNLIEASSNLAAILSRGNRVEEAEKIYEQILQKQPNHAQAIAGLLTLARQTCNWSKLEPLSEKLWQLSQTKPGVYPPFSSLFASLSAAQQQQVAQAHGSTYQERVKQQGQQLNFNFSGRGRVSDKIKIGYISGDFRNHVMADLVIELFARQDRNQFEVYGYSLQPDDGSYQRQKLQRDADQFREISNLTAINAAQQIYADAIDILVDLAGYTDYGNPEILAYKPAPLIINYLGYPGTSGADYVDYIITDSVIGIPAVADYLTEQCIYLPHSYQLNGHRQTISTQEQKIITDEIIYAIPQVHRSRFGLPEDAIIYCCFNKLDKVEPIIFATWMRILAQVPNSLLWLLVRHPDAVPHLAATAASHGIDPKRLILTPAAPKGEYLIRYQCADIFLDTLYYNAHVTASDALWMGVPVITTPGETFASRVSASLLTALGVPELITPSLAEYERLGVELGQNPTALSALKQKLREQRSTAPLFNAELTIRHLEAAYRQIWSRYIQGEPAGKVWVESEVEPPSFISKSVENVPLSQEKVSAMMTETTPSSVSSLNSEKLNSVSLNPVREVPEMPLMPPALLPPKDAPRPGTQTTITFNIDEGFQSWISKIGGSLAITTYQAGKIAMVGWNGEQVTLVMQTFLRPMGIATCGNRIAVATKQDVIILGNAAPLAHAYQENQLGRYDVLFLPRANYLTGDLYIHDLAFVEDELWVVNTRFSCVGKLSDEFNVVPVWKPGFISQLAPEDRCHLNGLCLVNGKPKYVTALGESDDVGGWRPGKANGGIIMEMASNEIILRGLSMPHSPVWYRDHLWVLNSGAGELWRISPQQGSYEVVCALPGFLRGLCFVGDYAVIGLCKIREQHIFGGLPIQAKFPNLYCGVMVIDIRTGQTVGLLSFPTGCEELYDIEFLPGVKRPMILNLEDPVRLDAFMMPNFAYWLRASFLSRE